MYGQPDGSACDVRTEPLSLPRFDLHFRPSLSKRLSLIFSDMDSDQKEDQVPRLC